MTFGESNRPMTAATMMPTHSATPSRLASGLVTAAAHNQPPTPASRTPMVPAQRPNHARTTGWFQGGLDGRRMQSRFGGMLEPLLALQALARPREVRFDLQVGGVVAQRLLQRLHDLFHRLCGLCPPEPCARHE